MIRLYSFGVLKCEGNCCYSIFGVIIYVMLFCLGDEVMLMGVEMGIIFSESFFWFRLRNCL